MNLQKAAHKSGLVSYDPVDIDAPFSNEIVCGRLVGLKFFFAVVDASPFLRASSSVDMASTFDSS